MSKLSEDLDSDNNDTLEDYEDNAFFVSKHGGAAAINYLNFFNFTLILLIFPAFVHFNVDILN